MRYQAIRTSVKVIQLTGNAEVTDSLGLKHPVEVGDILSAGTILFMDLDTEALIEPVNIGTRDENKSKKDASN